MASNYGAFSEKPTPQDNNYGAYQESKKVVFSSTPKKRIKASDTGKMNPLYKPKASPGPLSSASNVRENRIAAKSTRPAGESFSKPNKGTRPGAESFVPKAMKTKRGN